MNRTDTSSGKGRLLTVLLTIAVISIVIDQVTKFYAVERLTPGVIIPVVGDYLGWQLIFNSGAAFSMASGMTWVLTIVATVVVVVVLRVARRLRSRAWAVALGLLLGGAIGNLIDRLVRDPGFGQGHVVDFINYNGWFVGNVADIAIVLAAGLIGILALIGIEVDGRRPSRGDEETAPEGDSLADDESLLSEEPVADDDEFSPLVPEPTEENVDLASWVTGAPGATLPAARADAADDTDDADAEPDEATTAGAEPTASDGAHAPAATTAAEAPDTPADTAATGTAADSDVPSAPAAGANSDQVPTPEAPATSATPPRRFRSRREMRAATERPTSNDG